MKIVRFTLNMFDENCYLVYNGPTRECMVVDPGMFTAAERRTVDGFIAREKLTVKYLVNTHLHLDHCFGNNHIASTYGVTTLAHPADAPLGRDIKGQARLFGIFDAGISDIEEIAPLADGDTLTLGDETIRVIHTPGHSPGGLSLLAPADGLVLTGDTLFAGGNIGRTDLPGGSYTDLISSIRTKLLTLPEATRILPGHGPDSTIADSAV